MLKKKRRNYVLPSNEWVLAQCRKKVALMILNLHNEYIARKKRRERFDKAAPLIQKIVRGFLGIITIITTTITTTSTTTTTTTIIIIIIVVVIVLILLLLSTTW